MCSHDGLRLDHPRLTLALAQGLARRRPDAALGYCRLLGLMGNGSLRSGWPRSDL
jgi:hypothetical protein